MSMHAASLRVSILQFGNSNLRGNSLCDLPLLNPLPSSNVKLAMQLFGSLAVGGAVVSLQHVVTCETRVLRR